MEGMADMQTTDETYEFVTWTCIDCGVRMKFEKRDLPEGDLCPNCHYAERNKRTLGLGITRDGDVVTRKLEPWLDYLRFDGDT